jgi:hypothetical protein
MRGLRGQGNVVVHSAQARRYRCLCCGVTFAETKGTVFYRLRTDPQVVEQVLTLLAHGCPVPAIVAAFHLDERTVARWLQRAGCHAQRVQQALVRAQPLELQHVQADELWVKRMGGKRWMALALAVPTRFWLGGVISAHRDGELIRTLVEQVRRSARSLGILVCVDGLASYVTAFRRFFKEKVPREPGQRGGPQWRLAAGFLLGQVVKSAPRSARKAQEREAPWEVARRAALVRRGRCLAQKDATLQAGMSLVGVLYNFCDEHDSLREEHWEAGRRVLCPRTPAMAAGLTDHRWSPGELFTYRLAPERWQPPPRSGPPRQQPDAFRWKLRPHRTVEGLSTV